MIRRGHYLIQRKHEKQYRSLERARVTQTSMWHEDLLVAMVRKPTRTSKSAELSTRFAITEFMKQLTGKAQMIVQSYLNNSKNARRYERTFGLSENQLDLPTPKRNTPPPPPPASLPPHSLLVNSRLSFTR